MLKIDHAWLHPETLDNLLDEFILREGTDYGSHERSFESKKQQLRRQLDAGHCFIAYDSDSNSCNLLPTKTKN